MPYKVFPEIHCCVYLLDKNRYVRFIKREIQLLAMAITENQKAQIDYRLNLVNKKIIKLTYLMNTEGDKILIALNKLILIYNTQDYISFQNSLIDIENRLSLLDNNEFPEPQPSTRSWFSF